MKPRRHPRRAYDKDGKMYPPATVATTLAARYRTVTAWCQSHRCAHHAEIPLAGLPPDLPIPDIAIGRRCSKCGGRDVIIHLNVTELYDRSFGGKDCTPRGDP
ncbi:hypothetical protein [Microvirga brassicacearum]|uniref:Uncharacterized protein n=1 Tax=Microvirga brassicacearum TaxID=2580413 RepID=A0A5N3PH82_9HYPH|nr:hypothetical protein [Microvirga brassicacearum]KAB0269087.1 hypothetical protein FEZ63_02970 [Microvirga brassicacearum]